MPGISDASRGSAGQGFVGAANLLDQAGRGVYRFHGVEPDSTLHGRKALFKQTLEMSNLREQEGRLRVESLQYPFPLRKVFKIIVVHERGPSDAVTGRCI